MAMIHLRSLTLVFTATLLAACAGGGDAAPPTSPPPVVTPAPVAPGLISVSSSGLPAGAAADVQIVGPLPGASFNRTASAGTNWGDVPAGRYTVTVRPVRTALGVWTGAPGSFEITVPSAAPVQVVAAYRPAPSALAIAVAGLPANAAAVASVTPPGGAAAPVTQSATFTAAQRNDAPAETERWSITASPVNTDGARYAPARATFDTTVSFGDTARVELRYAIATGAIAVAVTGLPAGLPANVRVIGAGADSTVRSVPATTTLMGLEPGRYRVISAPVTQQGITYRPAADTLTVDVTASLVAAPAPVAYAAQVGRLVLQSSGLPSGSSPALRVVGGGIDRTFGGPGNVDSLPVGTYTVTAAPVLVGGDRWAATPASQTATISTGNASAASFTYALASGTLSVAVAGLPTGVNGDVRIAGPNGYARTVTAAETVRGLEPGRYTLTPRVVRTGTEAFGVQAGVTTLDVTASATPATALFTYVLVPTVVDVPVTGLPGSTTATIQLTDPAGANYNVTGSFRVVPAAAGRWRQTASTVNNGVAIYAPSRASRDTTVLPGDTLAFGVNYTITTGSLAVAVTGLPGGTNGSVTVTGPGGYTRSLATTTTLVLLTPGVYTITASAVTSGAGTYTPALTAQNVTVNASSVAAGATVTYTLPSGNVAIAAAGLPTGTTPVFTLTGPGTSRTQNGPGTVTGLAAGTWTVTAATVSAAGTTYTPSPSSAPATVTVGATSTVSFTYTAPPSGGGTNYAISNVYLTQAIQKLDNSVALVANRDALLRVFVVATAANSARPDVRVRIYDGTTLLTTTTLTAPEAAVRTSIAEGTLNSTWNMTVPGANVRTTMRVLVDLDPTQAVADASRSDNTWPSSGTPQPITVNTVPTFTVRFVPVVTGNDTGRVSNANRESFLATTRRVFPLQNVVSDVRAPFTSSADTLQNNDGNGKWLTVLSEINALRTTDGAPSTTHYYGVVRVRYTSGIAGYGYVPGRAAVGWDYLPSGDGVAAHEWGHNFGRSHAPCGTSGDSSYPYAGGVIGGFGWNSSTNTIVQSTATDLMGYCNNTWISDYTWTGVMTRRAAAGFEASAQSSGDGLLVWGRVVDGRIELEPSFRVKAPITPAPRGATHLVELLDAAGSSLLSLPLEASTVDHVDAGHEHRQFAVVLPWTAALEQRLQQVRVRDARVPTRAAVQRAGTAPALGAPAVGARALADDPAARLDRSAREVRVGWDNGTYRMAMVRDVATGQIMGFVRRQGAAVATGGRGVEVVFSDGVRSVVRR